MKRTKHQKRAALEQDYCQQYRKPDWDGCAANNYFARRLRSEPGISYLNKPKHAAFDRLRVIEIAENDLIAHIAHLSVVKEKIANYLEIVDRVKIQGPSAIDYPELYKSTYVAAANDILEKIRADFFEFQRPKSQWQ